MLNIFKAPIFEDHEHTRKAGLVHNLILGSMAIITIVEISDCFILPHNLFRWILLIAIYNTFGSALLIANKKGYTQFSSYAFVYFLFAMIFGFSFFAGGIMAPAIQTIPIVIVFAGLALGWRNGIITAIFASLFALALVYLHDIGKIPDTSVIQTPLSIWFTLLLSIGILGLLQYISVANIDNALQKAEKEIIRRKITEKELEHHKENLERTVQERTDELAAKNTELLETNEEIIAQKAQLERTLETLHKTQHLLVLTEKMASLSVLSKGIAHEINNPLNFIQGGTTLIEKYIQNHAIEHQPKINEYLTAIKTGIERASKIVSSLNQYNNDQIHKHISIPETIDNCLFVLQNQYDSEIEIVKKYDHENHLILGKEGELHQALLNIITNAYQAIEINGTITIETSIDTNFLNISISDTGKGISTKNLPKIFDPFFTTQQTGKGVGLGLTIAYHIIGQHNGTIEAESKLHKETKITIQLPLHITAPIV
jgi:signal transduction histidine kinase